MSIEDQLHRIQQIMLEQDMSLLAWAPFMLGDDQWHAELDDDGGHYFAGTGPSLPEAIEQLALTLPVEATP